MQDLILVVGSLNLDLVVQVQRHPKLGETILGSNYATYPGGKGANQAVAAALAGGRVAMIGAVGEDDFGQVLLSNLERHHVEGSGVMCLPTPTGIALITVDSQGQNTIVVSPGANGQVRPTILEHLPQARLILIQLEIPLETVLAVVTWAADQGIPVILNPSPIHPLPEPLFHQVPYWVLNETEAAILADRPVGSPQEATDAAQELHQRGIPTVIITLGGAGLVWVDVESKGFLPAHPVPVVDTTAAGDGFCGAFAVQIAAGASLEEALTFANAAAAIAVTRTGAQPSLASREEILALLNSFSDAFPHLGTGGGQGAAGSSRHSPGSQCTA